MKKQWLCFLLALSLLLGAVPTALGDASFPSTIDYYLPSDYPYIDPASGLPIYFEHQFHSMYNTEYFGHFSAEGLGGVTTPDARRVRVISKSATVWTQPRTGSSKLGSVEHNTELDCVLDANGYSVTPVSGFYPVWYKGQYGYINEDYVVFAPFEIVLMESNVPAYCAPTTNAKKVGSLSKHTRYTVLGFYGDYYIVSLRQAAAFIPMSVAHYDTHFERLFANATPKTGYTTVKTTMRTGPGEKYASVQDLKAGTVFESYAYLGGWYVVRYTTKTDSFYAFLRAWDVAFQ